MVNPKAVAGAAGQLVQAAGLSGDVGMSHQFRVSIDDGDFDLGTWTRVSGLSVQWTSCQYRCGENNHVLTFPGNSKYSTVKLARAACSDSVTVQRWLVATAKGRTPISGAVQLINAVLVPVATWELKDCYPIGWTITDFDAGTSKTAVETLELSHSGFLPAELKAGL